MRIAVVGSGYVGLVTGACFADLGHEVVLVDNDEQKLTALRNGEVPIHERFLPEQLERHRGQRIQFSGDLQAATRESEAVFIAVGTPPTETGDADLSYVESVAREIAGAVDGYKVVVEKSTVPVYTSQWIRTIIMRDGADPSHFDVASNPEFLREGTAVTDFLYPDRIVVGVESQRCAEVLRAIYEPLTSGAYYGRADAIPGPDRAQVPPRLIITSTKSAELIKHASNAFLAMKISFINAVASICESVGANVAQVCEGNILSFFHKWGTGAIAVSTAVLFPLPTSVLFAAAGRRQRSGAVSSSDGQPWRSIPPSSGETPQQGA